MSRRGRWIVATLNGRVTSLRGAKFSNSHLAGVLGRTVYTGKYYDKTADDAGNAPEPEDWIAVPCPTIVDKDQFERVQALRASLNPRKTAPHISARTTPLMGIARCGMPDCTCGMIFRSGKGCQYHYYVRDARVNQGKTCDGPSIHREILNGAVFDAVERQFLAPERLQTLLSDVINLSDEKRTLREAEFARRMSDNRAALAASSSHIDTLLVRGSRRITADTVSRFGKLLSARLRDEDSTLRTAYLSMLVSAVSVSRDEIVISGPTAALENGVSKAFPRLEGTASIFDRKWCQKRKLKGHLSS